MSQQASPRNPFLLMLQPELVLAAVEKSERLGQLHRHLCRPLDRPQPSGGTPEDQGVHEEGEEDEPRSSRS